MAKYQRTKKRKKKNPAFIFCAAFLLIHIFTNVRREITQLRGHIAAIINLPFFIVRNSRSKPVVSAPQKKRWILDEI